MSGLTFFKTSNLSQTEIYYVHRLGMKVWLRQKQCTILQHGNYLVGFCQAETDDTQATLAFVYESREEVDTMYNRLQAEAITEPRINDDYHIYHFFAKDPEGRLLEFQRFEHVLPPYQLLSNALVQRRSIRQFTNEPISAELLHRVMELCRYSPTAKNSQSYYYVVIDKPEVLELLSNIRENATKPIGRAPMAIAVYAAQEKTSRAVQDACIAGYHLLLSAYAHGLGTCWITDMDRTEVKALLNVPEEDYIACLTPLGYPAESKSLPERRDTEQLYRFI